jgi:hypothetical protein
MMQIQPMKPMLKSCKTCPFGKHGSTDVRDSVTARLMNLGPSQICHHPRISGKKETHLCRGGRDVQLKVLFQLGLLEHPTDSCFSEKSKSLGVTA